MSQEGVIHEAGLAVRAANPHTLVENRDGVGLSMSSGQLRLSSAATPNIQLGDMAAIRHANGQTTLDLGNLKAVSFDGYNVPLTGESLVRTARPEQLVHPFEPSNPTNMRHFVTVDAKARGLYIHPQDPRQKTPPQPFLERSRLQIAGNNPSRTFQATPTQLHVSQQWSLRTATDSDTFAIYNAKRPDNPPFVATPDSVTLGSMPSLYAGFPNTTVNNTLDLTASQGNTLTAPFITGDSAGGDIYGLKPLSLTAPQAVQLGPYALMQDNQLVLDAKDRAFTPIPGARLAISKELQIGNKYKIADTSGTLVLMDVTQGNKVIRNLARATAPPPILAVKSPFPMQQLSNAPGEKVVSIDLAPIFQSTDTATDGSPVPRMTYAVIVNPDGMATLDIPNKTLQLHARIPSDTNIPTLRTGRVQVRAISGYGALSEPLVIPFEERFFLPPQVLPPRQAPHILLEKQTLEIPIQPLFENPNHNPLSTEHRVIDDVKGRSQWVFRVNGNNAVIGPAQPPNPSVTLKASDKNAIYNVAVVAVNEFGMASTPALIPVREVFVFPPIQTQLLPHQLQIADEETAIVNLNEYFRDPQDYRLVFEVSTPVQSSITLQNGVLSIKGQNLNRKYPIQITVSNQAPPNTLLNPNGGTLLKQIIGKAAASPSANTKADPNHESTPSIPNIHMVETYIAPPQVPLDAQTQRPIVFAPVEVGDDETSTIDLSQRVQDPQRPPLPITFAIVPESNKTNARATIDNTTKQLVIQGQLRNSTYTLLIDASNGTKTTRFPVQVREVIWPTPQLAVA